MKTSLVFSILLSLFFTFSSFAQTNRAVVELNITAADYQVNPALDDHQFSYSTEVEIPVSLDGPFITLAIGWEQESMGGRLVRLFYNDQSLPFNHHIEQASDRQKSELAFISPETGSLSVKVITEGTPDLKLKIHFFNPEYSELTKSAQTNPATQRSLLCPCPQPNFLSRDEWCPDNDCPPNPFPATTIARHLIVHHSAGVNESSDWPAIVRGIWNYHVNTLGWSDVGYNWLVDPEGNLYEGRGKDVLGAHFCGFNSQTAGICMLGTYTSELVPSEAVNTLTAMLAWYACEDDINPLGISSNNGSGLNLNHISGHRDGCATECPGEAFYPTLSEIRQGVADHIELVCTPGQPDPLIESFTINQDTVFQDMSVVVATKVKNEGNVNIDSVIVRTFLDGAEVSLDLIEGLEPGELNIFFNNFTLINPGSMELCVSIDTLSNEPNTANNVSCKEVEVLSVVSVQEIEAGGFSIYPNPGSGNFVFENPENQTGQLFIYNTIGELVYFNDVQNQHLSRIDLTQSAKGLYLVKVRTRTGNYFKKLILQ